MKTAIVTFQGFTENLGRSSGTEKLWHRLRQFASSNVVVLSPEPWDSRTDRLAAFLQRQQVVNVIIIGYSWGAGFASQRFADHCAERGIAVPLMCLCDPVYRPLWLPTWFGALPLSFRAIIPKSASIFIPRNVKRVVCVHQKTSIPMGHPLNHDEDSTVVHPLTLLPYTHTTIDEAPEWHELVLSTIPAFFNQ